MAYRNFRFIALFLFISFAFAVPLLAQVDPSIENGFKAYGSYDISKVDSINLMNGGLTVRIPLPLSYPQRGGKLADSYFLIVNSKNWSVQSFTNSNGPQFFWNYGNGTRFMGPIGPYVAPTLPAAFFRTLITEVDGSNNVSQFDADYYIMTSDGSVHQLTDVSSGQTRTSFESADLSGFHVTATNTDPSGAGVGGNFVITDRNGNVYQESQGTNFPAASSPGCTKTGGTIAGSTTITTCPKVLNLGSVIDSNGNMYAYSFGSAGDTLGRGLPPLGQTSSTDSTGCVSSLPFTSAILYSYTGPSGATEQMKACYGSLSMQTNFGQANVAEFPLAGHSAPNPISIMTTLILPNGTKWTFQYDSYGNVTSLGLPTGGSVTYGWTEISTPSGNIRNLSRAVASRAVNDGVNSFTTRYTWGAPQLNNSMTNVVTDPLGNDKIHIFTLPSSGSTELRETTTKTYQGSQATGQLVRQVDTTYSIGVSNSDTGGAVSYAVPTAIKTTDSITGKVTLVQKAYDSPFGANLPILDDVTSEKIYDWGNGAPGPLLKETDTTYQWHNDSRYLTAHLVSLPASVIVKDSSGNRVSETDYTYDEAAYLTASNVTTQHGAAPNPSPVRGNPTTVSRWLNTTNTFIASHTNWYDTGVVFQSIDPLGHATTKAYSSTFAGAYPTTVTNALNQSATFNFDFGTGLITSATDLNGKATTFGYDNMFRLTQVSRPDGGADTLAYQETTSPFSATLTKKITSAKNLVRTNVFDSVGRFSEAELTSDPSCSTGDITKTVYDAVGRVSTVSNPYCTTSDTTYGITTLHYDVLDRTTSTTLQDSSTISTSYSGNVTTVTDEAGKQRLSVTDGLGRLIEVDEPNPGAAATLATGNVTVNGGEQSATSQAAGPATGTVTISCFGGPPCTDDSTTVDPCADQINGGSCPHTIFDSGTVDITVNGFTKSIGYGKGSTQDNTASAFVTAFNGDASSPVTAVLAPGTTNVVKLTSKATGTASDYSLSATSGTSDIMDFGGPSFTATPSGSTLTGGKNASSVADSGTVTITVNGTAYTVTYGSNDNTGTIAANLASMVNSGVFASASPSGATVKLTSKTSGTLGNYSLSASDTYNTSQFAQPSFTTSTSGPDLSGGKDATAINNSPFVTLYTYDTLGNLTCAVQKGTDTSAFTTCASAPATWRPRTFTYNSLSQLLTATNPESGTITYTYDNDGNVLTKLDARGITTTFGYDALNRLTSKTYSNGDPSVAYHYDESACLGASACSNIGHRTSMTDAAGSEAWTYDLMGRPVVDQRTTRGVTKSTSYTYNLDSSVNTITYPGGNRFLYAYNAAAQPTSVVDSARTYSSGALYSPSGSLASLTTDTMVSTFYSNNRLQPCRISVKSTGTAPSSCTDTANVGNLLDMSYNFSLGAGDNGNVTSITNNRDNTRSQNFTYDALNRLASAQTTSTSGSNCWGLTFGYDTWGNLLSSTSSAPGCSEPLPLNVSATAANRISGFCYDASGNLLDQGACPASGPHVYTYNAEGELVSTAGVNYLYDGDGKRVSKSNGKLYWYGMGSDTLDETDASGNLTNEYVFFGGKRMARRSSTNVVDYYFADHLGTARVVASSAGAILDDSDFYPFGGERAITSSSGNSYKFEGKERDAESGLDDFDARYYSSTLGRFISADWSAIPIPVPYANFTNPQTLNLYSIVHDNPETFADLDGHEPQYAAYASSTGGSIENSYAGCTPGAPNCENGGESQSPPPPPQNLNPQTEAGVGIAKELVNTVTGAINLLGDASALLLGTGTPAKIPELAPSNDLQKVAMTATAVALVLAPGGVEASAAGRASELASAMGKTKDFVTIAVTETKEGVNVISSSEKALRPAVRALLKEGEVAVKGAGHAEVAGINGAKQLGLTPTGVAASRGICPGCAEAIRAVGAAILSSLK